MMDEFKVDVRFPAEGAVVLDVGGFIDTNTALALERALLEHGPAADRVVVVDLSGVDYISSAGWGVMVAVVNGIRDRGADLRLSGMRPEVDQVYRLLEFPSILQAFDTVEEALQDQAPGS